LLVRSRVSGACTEDKVKEKYRVEVRKEEMGEKRWNQLCPQGLEAEYMVLQNDNDDQVVQKAFDKAISTPARARCLQDAAPANERARSFFALRQPILLVHMNYIWNGAQQLRLLILKAIIRPSTFNVQTVNSILHLLNVRRGFQDNWRRHPKEYPVLGPTVQLKITSLYVLARRSPLKSKNESLDLS
jgi:hypothetical protein